MTLGQLAIGLALLMVACAIYGVGWRIEVVLRQVSRLLEEVKKDAR